MSKTSRDIEWGRLKDHWSPCPSEDEDDGDWCPEDCENGKVRWGSFYRQDIAECDSCHEEKGVAEFGPQEWLCVDCYMRAHQNDCGCDLWEMPDE